MRLRHGESFPAQGTGTRGMSGGKAPAAAVWALGVTQIVGYGTLYYSYSMLSPAVAAELGWPEQWVFAVLSAALLASALLAPVAGHWADRVGAGRLMVPGSAAAAAALLLCALAPGRLGFAVGVLAMELASCFVLYATAFVALVQMGDRSAQRSITHLTLIAGFASTVFWPFTAFLKDYLGWREILVVFAALNLLVCLPLHAWLARRPLPVRTEPEDASPPTETVDAARVRTVWSPVFILMLAGFAFEGFILSAVLVQMVPLLAAVGLGVSGVFVATLFGPSQVASRLINMLFGGGLRQIWLALAATGSLAAGLAVLLLTAPSIVGAVSFAVLFGLGSGLMSIVGGTLPLELFGRAGYGGRVGWITAARQFSAAFAPFGFALMTAGLGVFPALWINVAVGAVGIVAFAVIAAMHAPSGKARPASTMQDGLGAELS
jgi:MFS family permease